MTTLESLRAKIIEVKYPEPEYGKEFRAVYEDIYQKYPQVLAFGLADVLRAIRKYYTEKEMMIRGEHELLEVWNLSKSLDEQSPEVHEFLAKILTN